MSVEMAVTSAPVSSLTVMLCSFIAMVANHAELGLADTVSRNAVLSWLSQRCRKEIGSGGPRITRDL